MESGTEAIRDEVLEREYLLEKQDQLERARNGLLNFTTHTFPKYDIGWHHRALCKALNRFASGELKRLIVTLPPRHGKSETVSRRLPAYLLGLHPEMKIIGTSYADALAASMNRDVQRIIESDSYKELFPNTRLRGDKMIPGTTSWMKNSGLFETVGYGGCYRSAGVGGSLTGTGGNCFPAGTMVTTERGDLDIADLALLGYRAPKVLSFNHATGATEWASVVASREILSSDLVEIITSKGKSVVSTPDHRIYNGEHGYREARLLSSGSRLTALPVKQDLHQMWSDEAGPWSDLRRVLSRVAGQARDAAVCALRKVFSAAPVRAPEIIAQGAHGRLLLSSLFQRTPRGEKPQALSGVFHNALVRNTGGASYRRGHPQRLPRKSDSALPSVPYDPPQIQTDTVSMVRQLRTKSQPVYDIQVEGNSNFFANGLLVHNCVIIDDPIKNQEEADSALMRDRVFDWYGTTLYTRLEKNAGLLVTATRWHQDDLIGRLIKSANDDPLSDQWEVMSFPAISEGHPSTHDPRSPGEALWPNRFDATRLMGIKASIGTRNWSALYQQRPAPEEGMIVNRAWWQYYDAVPLQLDCIIQAWDLTFTKSATSDYVVGVVMGKKGSNIYLLDMIRDRLSFTSSIAAIKRMTLRWPQAEAKYVEAAANGHALIDTLRSEISGLIPVKPNGSKVARVNAVSPRIEAGNVWLPHKSLAPWVEDVVEEWTMFPAGANDDVVDAMTHGITKLIERGPTDFLPVSLSGNTIFPRQQ